MYIRSEFFIRVPLNFKKEYESQLYYFISCWIFSTTCLAKPVNLLLVACRKEFLHGSDCGVVCQSRGI